MFKDVCVMLWTFLIACAISAVAAPFLQWWTLVSVAVLWAAFELLAACAEPIAPTSEPPLASRRVCEPGRCFYVPRPHPLDQDERIYVCKNCERTPPRRVPPQGGVR